MKNALYVVVIIGVLVCVPMASAKDSPEELDVFYSVDLGRDDPLALERWEAEHAQAKTQPEELDVFESVDMGRYADLQMWQWSGYTPRTNPQGYFINPFEVAVWGAYPEYRQPIYPYVYPRQPQYGYAQLSPSVNSTLAYNAAKLREIAARQQAEQEAAALQAQEMQLASVHSLPLPENEPTSAQAQVKVRTEAFEADASLTNSTQEQIAAVQALTEALTTKQMALEQEKVQILQQQQDLKRIQTLTVIGVLISLPLLIVIGWAFTGYQKNRLTEEHLKTEQLASAERILELDAKEEQHESTTE